MSGACDSGVGKAGTGCVGGDENRMLLDFAVSQSPAVLYLGAFTKSDTVRFVSSNAQSVIGWTPSEMVGPASIWRDRVHPDDLSGYDAAVERVQKDCVLTQEYRLRTPDGDYRWMRDQQRLTTPGDPRGEYVGCIIDITAEKAAEADLVRAEAIHRAIVDAAVDAVITTDRDGLIIDFNPAAEEMLGYRAHEAEGVLLCDLTMPEPVRERRKKSFAAYRRGAAGSTMPDCFETDVLRRDGSTFPAEVRMRRVLAGAEMFVVTEIRDLSERAEAEATHRRLTQMLRDAVDSLPAGFAISDAEERIVLCNDAFAEPYGVDPDELIGLDRHQLVPRLYRKLRRFNGVNVDGGDRHAEMVAERLGNPDVAPSELEMKNGEWRLVSSFPTADGGMVTIRTDITALKQAEQAMHASESVIRMAVEACPVPLGLVRANDGMIIYESPASKELFRRPRADSESYTAGIFVSHEDRQHFLDTLREDGGIDGFEVELRRADGEEFWGSISASLIDYKGEDCVVTSVYDLTEKRIVREEMARQREALHQSEKLAALGELLASVAHELNNPLSVVVGQALLLKETASDKTIAERAAKIGGAADRCSRIVRTFLAMARQQPMERRPVDLNRVVELAMEVTGYSLRAADIDVRLSLSRELPTVWGDADQLNQVLTNLILNAQKALEESKAPRRVKIITNYREQTRELILKIKDNGPGIPEPIRSRIFEPFFTTRQVGSGTGIGLAFCHRIITTHGGTISVETGIDGGASFVIRLPVTRMGTVPAEGEVARAAQTARAAILVVDDEVAVAEMLADILEEDGHKVEIAHSGSQALDRIELRDFDLILSDLRMPDIDGPAMFDAIREARSEMVPRVAFITGDTMSARIRSFLQESERPYIEKPIVPQDVRDLVQQMLREADQTREETAT
ncbi:PAS domain S-box protein [Microbaculum marinisediminis]|uniref:histidine kinase n=1 Tax=Microbaculum marinisediminis TaxID=2931392 RepID=A0AAW5QTI6_9HYPH|nr:PAS domain S-box protein [Microbaculum sp. A6E488]MCT8971351.1 PAS domain S-box protein [Microbaculum sp. A6E488]